MQQGDPEPTHIVGDIRFQTAHGVDHLLATLDRWHAATRNALRQEMEGRASHAGSIRLGMLNYDAPAHICSQ